MLGLHKTTLEFTKDDYLTKKGDCIVGIKADFCLEKLKEFVKNNDKIKIKFENEIINAEINKEFNDDKEMVIRKSDFKDKRTFAIRADKAACDIDREIIERLKNPEEEVEIILVPQRV